MKIIDVSTYQGVIDWEKVKNFSNPKEECNQEY